MRVRPPYLFDDRQGSALDVVSDVGAATVEMTVHGRWSRRLGADISHAMKKCLAEHPAVVLVDLRDLQDPSGASAAMWLAGRRAGLALRPPVQVALCLAPDDPLAARLQRLGTPRYLAMYGSLAQARVAVAGRRPLTDMLQWPLAPAPESASVARDLIGQACQAWGSPSLLHPARLVVSELVANAVEHAGTEHLVTVSRRGAALHLSVRDGDPRPPRLLPPAPVVPGEPLDERGRGLRLVHATAFAWGSMPTRTGKVVWASVRDK